MTHNKGEYVRGAVYTNTIEGVFSLLKRELSGIYHHISPAHLSKYLTEFDFRYNARKVSESERADMVLKGAEGKRLMYRCPAQ